LIYFILFYYLLVPQGGNKSLHQSALFLGGIHIHRPIT